ncbi:MAG: hypothetical protein MZV64_59860 [Ignavibacteriales bacterium]|nr:hypothetical protein [Ignavibacteriales bacterium]
MRGARPSSALRPQQRLAGLLPQPPPQPVDPRPGVLQPALPRSRKAHLPLALRRP